MAFRVIMVNTLILCGQFGQYSYVVFDKMVRRLAAVELRTTRFWTELLFCIACFSFVP
jgi:hypothetical protein